MSDERGLTLVESLVGLFLIGFCVMAAAPMFMYSVEGTAIGADTSLAGTVAVERMERLRALRFDDPASAFGGDLDVDTTTAGVVYFDNSLPDVTLRWRVDDNSATLAGTKIITLRALARRDISSGPRMVTLTTLRGE